MFLICLIPLAFVLWYIWRFNPTETEITIAWIIAFLFTLWLHSMMTIVNHRYITALSIVTQDSMAKILNMVIDNDEIRTDEDTEKGIRQD